MRHSSVRLLLISGSQLFLTTLGWAGGGPASIPSMQEILSHQFSCKPAEVNRMGWAKDPVFGHMTAKAWGVVSELKVQELSPGQGNPPSRRFEVTFKAWDEIYCSNERPLKLAESTPMLKKLVLELSYDGSERNHGLVLDTENQGPETYENPFFRTIITEPEGDDPTYDFANNLSCLIDKDDFVQGRAQIGFEQLCAGQPAAKRRGADRYIRWLKKALK